MAQIVAMPGHGPPAENIGLRPVDGIVVRLEELLTLARTGQIRSIAYAIVDHRNCTFHGWVSGENEPTGHALISSVVYLQHDIVAEKSCTAAVPPLIRPDPQ